jgi:hypothetical protein
MMTIVIPSKLVSFVRLYLQLLLVVSLSLKTRSISEKKHAEVPKERMVFRGRLSRRAQRVSY